METKWVHSIMASTAPDEIIIWNYQLLRGSCIVCKVLQLCMCSAGSVPHPFSAGYSMTVDWRGGGDGRCLSRWMSLRAPPCSSAVCSWQRLVRRSSHNRQVISPLNLSVCDRGASDLSLTHTLLFLASNGFYSKWMGCLCMKHTWLSEIKSLPSNSAVSLWTTLSSV